MPDASLPATAESGLSGGFLLDELRPYPGRTATVIRMVVASLGTTIIVMTFRIPYAFLGIFHAFVISRQSPEWVVRNGLPAVIAGAAAVAYVTVGVRLFYDYQVLHFAFLVASLYLVFYLKRALANDSVTFSFGVTAIVAMTLFWDRPNPTEAHLESTISLAFVVMLGTLIAMAIAWVALELETGATRPDSPRAVSEVPVQTLLAPDAFSNPEYLRFALKGCVAGSLCYFFDSGVAWPVIMGACAQTCIVSARPLSSGAGTAGERFATGITALFVGGVLLGMGSLALVLPFLDSVMGFALQFVTISAIAAWVATSSPRLAYAGTLGAMGYFFPMVQGFGPNQSLVRSGAFLGDIFLALVAYWLVFDNGSDQRSAISDQRSAISDQLNRAARRGDVLAEG